MRNIVADRDDVGMMSHPDLWPNWPLLPLKRYVDNDFETGYLMMTGSNAIQFRRGNVFGPKETDEVIPYTSFEELVELGWRVD